MTAVSSDSLTLPFGREPKSLDIWLGILLHHGLSDWKIAQSHLEMKWKETAMRRIALVAVVLSGFFLITGQPVTATHITETYELVGTQWDGSAFSSFTACLHFNYASIPGDLKIFTFIGGAPSGDFLLTWRHQDLDTKLKRFQAVRKFSDPSPDSPVTVMIFGDFKGPAGKVVGQGVADTGYTFDFHGIANAKCAPPE